MSILIAILLLCALAAIWTVSPLLRTPSDQMLGDGLEEEGRVAAWNQEKDRLVSDMVALDVAYSEQRISKADYDVQRALVMTEAEKAAIQLSKLRTNTTERPPVSRTYPRVAIAVALGVIVCGASVAVFLNDQDMRSDKNPHADGSIPLPAGVTAAGVGAAPNASAQAGGSGMPMNADGTPDIGAMVARLEARVKGSDATVNDVLMLARSYRVMDREAESLTLYRKAQVMEPNDPSLKLVLASALIRSENESNRGEGEKMVDDILQAEPKKPEALWLKSLGLMNRHEIGKARELLTELDGLVTENSDAKKAVAELLANLASTPQPATPSSPATPSAAPTTPSSSPATPSAATGTTQTPSTDGSGDKK